MLDSGMWIILTGRKASGARKKKPILVSNVFNSLTLSGILILRLLKQVTWAWNTDSETGFKNCQKLIKFYYCLLSSSQFLWFFQYTKFPTCSFQDLLIVARPQSISCLDILPIKSKKTIILHPHIQHKDCGLGTEKLQLTLYFWKREMGDILEPLI